MVRMSFVKLATFGFGQDFEAAKEALNRAGVSYKTRTNQTSDFGGRVEMGIFVQQAKLDFAAQILSSSNISSMYFSPTNEPFYFKRARRRSPTWRRRGKLVQTGVPLGSSLQLVRAAAQTVPHIKARDVFTDPDAKPTINYVGRELHYTHTYNEEAFPNWSNDAQSWIDDYKRKGKRAAVIHRGIYHDLYTERD